MKLLQQKAAEKEILVKEVKAITDKPDTEWTEADIATVETKSSEIEALEKEITRLKSVEALALKNAERVLELSGVDTTGRPNVGGGSGTDVSVETKAGVVPVQFRGSNPHYFRTISDSRSEAQYKGYRMGMWLMATIGANSKAAKWCTDNGLPIVKSKTSGDERQMFRAQAENVNEAGGFLVPHVLEADLIQLREQFGVARQLFKKVNMTSDTYSRPRRTGGLTAFHMTDNQAAIESQKAWDLVTLTAVKIMTLTRYSNELSEDSLINVADDLSYEIAWAFALTEDQDCFLGDGTSKYGGIVGVSQRLTDVWTTAGGAGLIVGAAGTGASWGGFLLKDFNNVKAALPRYAALANPCWVTTTEFYYSVMEKLLTAAGGNRVSDIQNPGEVTTFLSKPVVFAQVLPIAPAVSSIPLYYGAFQLGADFGDRRETTIALSEHYGFAQDQMAIRGTERYAANIHDVGGPSTAANPAQAGPQAGPIVGLMTATS